MDWIFYYIYNSYGSVPKTPGGGGGNGGRGDGFLFTQLFALRSKAKSWVNQISQLWDLKKMIKNTYADPNPCGAARFSGPRYVVAARKSSIYIIYINNTTLIYWQGCVVFFIWVKVGQLVTFIFSGTVTITFIISRTSTITFIISNETNLFGNFWL